MFSDACDDICSDVCVDVCADVYADCRVIIGDVTIVFAPFLSPFFPYTYFLGIFISTTCII